MKAVGRLLTNSRGWLKEPSRTSRGTTIALWGVIVGTCFGASWGVYQALERVKNESAARAATQCAVRAQSRLEVRSVFLDLYDLVDSASPGGDPIIENARARLDELYPPIDVQECLEKIT